MPYYDYKCESCGELEFFQPIKNIPFNFCPECGSRVKRLISQNITFFLRGSGWSSGINGEKYKTKVKEIEKGLEREEQQLLAKGHKIFPKGCESGRDGDII